jgi:serine/threonine protein kinase
MDLTPEAIHDVIHPTAIFEVPIERQVPVRDLEVPPEPAWEDSQLNIKNRIDSTSPLQSPLWSIDGGAGLGTQFFAIATFVQDAPPMRFDVFIADKAIESRLMRHLLDLDDAFHARDRSRVQRQAITSYIVRALQIWTTEVYGLEKVKDMYYTQPFGSRIIFETLPLHVRDARIVIGPMHNLEHHQLSPRELGDMWKMDVGQMPPTVDIFGLVYVRQLQDSVCLVRCRGDEGSGKLWALKALVSSVKYMYHELRNLLSMPPHPNVLGRPAGLVTKKTRVNAHRTVVIGFLEPYYSGINLRDMLPVLRMNNRLRLDDQIRWAKQICAGLAHIRQKGNMYYPDMRLDQIVMTHDNARPVILDFEQRGVWCEFASPEVNALEYMRILASDDLDGDDDCSDYGDYDDYGGGGGDSGGGDRYATVPTAEEMAQLRNRALRARYAALLGRLHPGWRDLAAADGHYNNPPHGYNIAWTCLTPTEQESAEVYMLGRLLWCVFEGMSAPQRGAVWQSYRNEPEFEFPSFSRTPPELRDLIERCTAGRRPQLSSLVIRRGNKLELRHHGPAGDGLRAPGSLSPLPSPNPMLGANPGREAEIRIIRQVAAEFWRTETAWAENFLLERERKMKQGTWEDNIFGRPSLDEVESTLAAFQRKLMGERVTLG